MGIRNATATYVVPVISHEDVITMTAKQARMALFDFCKSNGFKKEAVNGAFRLFRQAAATPGVPIIVRTWGYEAVATSINMTRAIHDCMEAITATNVSQDLAIRGFDASPESHFEHDMRHDACEITSVATNAPR